MFKLVGEANAVLSDPQKRAHFDAGYTLEEIDNGTAGMGGGFGGGYGGGGFGGMDMEDVMAQFFQAQGGGGYGGGFGGMGGGGGRRGRPGGGGGYYGGGYGF